MSSAPDSKDVYAYKIKEIARIVDGDTIDIVISLGFDLSYKVRVRLRGVDTPETRTRDLTEKKFGKLAEARVTELLTNAKELLIRTELDSRSKYGGLLGEIFADGVSVNQKLIDERHAVPYEGLSKDLIKEQHLANRRWLTDAGLA